MMDDDTTDAAWNQKELDERRRRDDDLMAGNPEYDFLETILGKKVRFTFAGSKTVTGRLVGTNPLRVQSSEFQTLVVIGDFEAMIIYPENRQ